MPQYQKVSTDKGIYVYGPAGKRFVPKDDKQFELLDFQLPEGKPEDIGMNSKDIKTIPGGYPIPKEIKDEGPSSNFDIKEINAEQNRQNEILRQVVNKSTFPSRMNNVVKKGFVENEAETYRNPDTSKDISINQNVPMLQNKDLSVSPTVFNNMSDEEKNMTLAITPESELNRAEAVNEIAAQKEQEDLENRRRYQDLLNQKKQQASRQFNDMFGIKPNKEE
jgi:hypothetical protein